MVIKIQLTQQHFLWRPVYTAVSKEYLQLDKLLLDA